MSTILDQIIENKKREVLQQKQSFPLSVLEGRIDHSHPRNSLVQQLRTPGASGIIAEFKRRSPSKGIINPNAEPGAITKGYALAGASALSVLTESAYFGAQSTDFEVARQANPLIPMLRKDFMVDAYQLYESRLMHADVILLIAAALNKKEITHFTAIAHLLGMEVLLELHDHSEIDKIAPEVDIIGINNRNLKDFKVDIDRSLQLFDELPLEMLKISESGLSDPMTVDSLRAHGFSGFLMGENFMKSNDPATACANFIAKLKRS